MRSHLILAIVTGCALILIGCSRARDEPAPKENANPTVTSGQPLNGTAASGISGLALSAAAFNPNTEKVQLLFTLDKPSALSVEVWDSDGGLVAELTKAKAFSAGRNSVEWDGKDLDGRVVPDEAYMFTLTGDAGAYDPATFSGGIVGDITDGRYGDGEGTMVYALPSAARVLVRLGIAHGPMLKTLVDWKPRVSGSITEYWDGMDENRVVRLGERQDFNALITYVTLPDATVITHGNSAEDYRSYKLGRGQGRRLKPERARLPDPQGRLRPEGLVPPAFNRAPQVNVKFSKRDGAQPTNEQPGNEQASNEPVRAKRDGTLEVGIDVAEADRASILSDQFEIIFYVDGVFFAEAERGYLPYTWKWELARLPPGEHLLTVNIASFKGQVGVASRKVIIEAP